MSQSKLIGGKSIRLMSPASPDPISNFEQTQSKQNDVDFQSAQKLVDSDDELKPTKLRRRNVLWDDECSRTGTCGYHTHLENGEEVPCTGTPWGRVSLLEYDMPRKQLMTDRYQTQFKTHRALTIHFVAMAYKQANLDFFAPVEKKGPIVLYYQLLNNPPHFSYRCMTLCDMELLRKTLLNYFGIVQCSCDGFMGLSMDSFETDMDKGLMEKTKSSLKTIGSTGIKSLVKDCDLKIICEECSAGKK